MSFAVNIRSVVGFGAILSLASTFSAFTQEAPAQHPTRYCASVGTDDRVRPIPPALAPQALRLFYLAPVDPGQVQRSTVYRCMDGSAWLCNYGANLTCAKADVSRVSRKDIAERTAVQVWSQWPQPGVRQSTRGNASGIKLGSRAARHRSIVGASAPVNGSVSENRSIAPPRSAYRDSATLRRSADALAAACIAAQTAVTSAASVAKAPTETRASQRPSTTAGVR